MMKPEKVGPNFYATREAYSVEKKRTHMNLSEAKPKEMIDSR
jgi:hypothetical protein